MTASIHIYEPPYFTPYRIYKYMYLFDIFREGGKNVRFLTEKSEVVSGSPIMKQ